MIILMSLIRILKIQTNLNIVKQDEEPYQAAMATMIT